MKHTITKLASLALSLALVLTLFAGVPAFAENSGTEPAGTIQTNSEDDKEPAGGDADTSSQLPTPTPAPAAPFITNYSVDVHNGNQYYPGDKANITLEVVDEWAKTHHDNAGSVTMRARISTGSFAGKDAVATSADGTFRFEFKDIVYNGGDNTFSVDLIVDSASEERVITPLSLSIPQCTARPDPTPAPTPAPAEVPKIMVKDFTFGGTSVEAGKEFTLELTLFTTSGNTNLEDVMVGLTFPADTKNISLASGSMNTYVGAMAPNETRTISYKMVTDATMTPGAVGITVQLTSKNGEAASSPISIPVTQPERFEITNIEAPETMMMGEEGYLSVTFVNKGKSAINNLTAEIQGDNLANPGQSQFLGNVAAGTENSVDFSVIAAAEGVINGKVILSYENAKGETATLEKEFSCTVQAMPVYDDPGMMDPGMMDPGMMDPTMGEDVGGGMPIWGWALIAVGVVAVAVVIAVVIRKKQAAKKLAQLEDEDEDI